MNISDHIVWYPPAETNIPLHNIFEAFFSYDDSFEQVLAKYLKVDLCVSAVSARALLALLLKELHRGDSHSRNVVLIPGYTCYSVAASIVRAGLKIRVYDLDPKTLNPDMSSIRKGLEQNCLAIIHQHLFGIPSPIEDVKKIAEENGSYVIEDAAQGLGGSLKEKALGSIGHYGLYSFGRGKPLPLGCGGALIGENKEILQKIKIPTASKERIQLFITASAKILAIPFFYRVAEVLPLGLGQTIFDSQFPIAAMPSVLKKLGVILMDHLKILNEHRTRIASIYSELLNEKFQIVPMHIAKSVFTRFPVLTDIKPIPMELFRLGVRRMYPQAITDVPDIHPFLVDSHVKISGAIEIAQKLITLPTHSSISDDRARSISSYIERVCL